MSRTVNCGTGIFLSLLLCYSCHLTAASHLGLAAVRRWWMETGSVRKFLEMGVEGPVCFGFGDPNLLLG